MFECDAPTSIWDVSLTAAPTGEDAEDPATGVVDQRDEIDETMGALAGLGKISLLRRCADQRARPMKAAVPHTLRAQRALR